MNYYYTVSAMMYSHKLPPSAVEEMLPYELDIYIMTINQIIEDQKNG